MLIVLQRWTGTVVVKQLLSFKIHQSIHAGVVISGPILSLTTDIMYISMFPGFLEVDSNDPYAGTTDDYLCCFC